MFLWLLDFVRPSNNYPLSTNTSFSPSCDCGHFCIVAWTAVLTWKVQNKDEATRSSFFCVAQPKWCTHGHVHLPYDEGVWQEPS